MVALHPSGAWAAAQPADRVVLQAVQVVQPSEAVQEVQPSEVDQEVQPSEADPEARPSEAGREAPHVQWVQVQVQALE